MKGLIKQLEEIGEAGAHGKLEVQKLKAILLRKGPLGEELQSALREIEALFDYIKNKV